MKKVRLDLLHFVLGIIVDSQKLNFHQYTLTNEEFLDTKRIMDDFKDSKTPANRGEFRYVLVRGPGAVQIGRLDRDQSKLLFAALEKYFKGRKPDVYAALSNADRMFW